MDEVNCEWLTFNVTLAREPDIYRVFNGLEQRMLQLPAGSPDDVVMKELYEALGQMRTGHDLVDPTECRRAATAIMSGLIHIGPRDKELIKSYNIGHPEPRPVMICLNKVQPQEV